MSFEQRLCQSTMKQCTRFAEKSVEEFTLLRLEEAASAANCPD